VCLSIEGRGQSGPLPLTHCRGLGLLERDDRGGGGAGPQMFLKW